MPKVRVGRLKYEIEEQDREEWADEELTLRVWRGSKMIIVNVTASMHVTVDAPNGYFATK